MKATLTVTSGPERGRTFEFTGHDTFTVGRSKKATFAVKGDPHFSRVHFLVEISPPQIFVKNLSRTGITKVNGIAVQDALLNAGDVISGGRETTLRVDIEGSLEQTVDWISDDSGCSTASPTTDRSRDEPEFPGYSVSHEIGQGAMGKVYLATRPADNQQVAIKVMRPEVAIHQNAVQLFLREASLLSKLTHPGIVGFHEVGQSGDCLYLVMEYVPGMHLEAVVQKHKGKVPVPAVLYLFDQVLAALEYAHGLGIVHRDIKPQNILAARTENAGVAKLADFGVARNFEHAGFSGLTRTNQKRGTFLFMSPEQVLDARSADPRSDLYSVGASLYRVLTGESLWNLHDKGMTADPLMLILYEEPAPIRDRRPDISEQLAEIIHRAIAHEPDDRFDSATEMRTSLRNCMSER